MADAGTSSLRTSIAYWSRCPFSKVVIGSETLDSARRSRDLTSHIPWDRRTFSLDMGQGRYSRGIIPLRVLDPEALSFSKIRDERSDHLIS
jgi:hypothetical protein